jgi:hypothetical protein
VGGRTPGPIASGGSGRRTTTRGPIGLDEDALEAATSTEQFKQAVFNLQLSNARAAGRRYFPAVPADDLEVVEGAFKLRKAAAQDCTALLAAARADLAADQAAARGKAREVTGIGVCSAYRDYDHDMRAWNSAFGTHYARTRSERSLAVGGAHGPAAVRILVQQMQKYKAVPGFSNHSNATAVDFTTMQGGTTYAAYSAQRAGWRATWFHAWLVINAERFGFRPLATEEWHWDH